jgi:nitrous oxidase accessory protein
MRLRRLPALVRGSTAALALILLGSWWESRAALPADDIRPAEAGFPAPPRPAGAVAVSPAEDLAALLAAAAPGTALALDPGRYTGPFEIPAGVVLWGPRAAVLETSGAGTTVRMTGEGAALLGLTVDGSGGRYDAQDAAVHVGADRCRVEGVEVKRAIYGLVVEKADEVVVRGNRIRGTEEGALGLRGDGLRVWETTRSEFSDNLITDSRDMVVWYSSDNRIERNRVSGSRYGTHFMYSHRNTVSDNSYVGNVVGIFAMYSRDLVLRGNLMADCSGAAGIGIGIKESSDLVLEGNRLIHDTVGVFIDNSPFVPGTALTLAGNELRLCETAVVLHSSLSGVELLGNDFCDNFLQVRVDGGGDAVGLVWRGNHFDDYAGFDLDGDGAGDLPYELRSLSSQVVSRQPDLAFFRGTPALAALDMVSRALPMYPPKLVLRDEAPRLSPEVAR